MWKRVAIASLIGNAALASGALYVALTHRTKIVRGGLSVPLLQFDGLLSSEPGIQNTLGISVTSEDGGVTSCRLPTVGVLTALSEDFPYDSPAAVVEVEMELDAPNGPRCVAIKTVSPGRVATPK